VPQTGLVEPQEKPSSKGGERVVSEPITPVPPSRKRNRKKKKERNKEEKKIFYRPHYIPLVLVSFGGRLFQRLIDVLIEIGRPVYRVVFWFNYESPQKIEFDPRINIKIWEYN
jgi:hypothetical protein